MNTLFIDGIGFWSPRWPGWPEASAAFRCPGEPEPLPACSGAGPRPQPLGLGSNERRRAPDSVLMALQVAEEAVAMSGQDAARLASVFTSTHGDLATVDALCKTLAADPRLLSPTRFHHSVHNVASGYWAMATGCPLASIAVSNFGHAFAAGWLEAATRVASSAAPALLVGYDTPAIGALASVNRSRGSLGLALVLGHEARENSLWRVDWGLKTLGAGPGAPEPLRLGPAADTLAENAMADGLPLFQALAASAACELTLPLGAALGLEMRLQPLGTQA